MENNHLSTAPIGKLLLKYSIPGIIGMLVSSLYNVVDRIFIGHIAGIGDVAMAGLTVTVPVTTIILAFSMLVGFGATSNISINLGKGNVEDAAYILGNTFSMAIFVSVILTAIGLLFCEPILNLFSASNETMPYAKEYIIVILWGTVFNLTSFAMNSTIRADGSPVIAGATMLVGCGLNIILDPIFIFVFKWGIRGAAIATIISQFVSFAWVMLYYFGKNSKLKITRKTIKPKLKYIVMILAIGVSPFAMQISNSAVQAIFNSQLKSLGGDVAMGAYLIINSLSMLFLMAIFGLNQGGQPIIGYNYGAKNYGRVKKTLKTTISIGTAYLFLGFLIIQIFPEFLIGLFNDDATLVQIATDGIKINLFTMPLLATCVMGSTFFQFIGKPKVSLLLSLMRQFLLLIPVLLILPHFFGLRGVWLAQPICDIISVTVILTCVFIEFRKYKETDTVV